jgi:hypothetical protein
MLLLTAKNYLLLITMINESNFKISIEKFNYDYELNQIVDNNLMYPHLEFKNSSKFLDRLVSNNSYSNATTLNFDLMIKFGPNAFIIFIILFYAAFLTLVLYMNIKPSNKTTTESMILNKINNEYLMNSIRQQIDIKRNKNLLEELKNKEFRQKAWEIYRSEKNINLKNEEIILKAIDKKLFNIIKSSDQFEESELNSSFNKLLKDTKKSFILSEKINSKTNSEKDDDENRNLLNISDEGRTSSELLFKYDNDKVNLLKNNYKNDLIESNNNCYFTISGNSLDCRSFIIDEKLDRFSQSTINVNQTKIPIPLIVITDTSEDPFKYRKSSLNSSNSDKKSISTNSSYTFSDKFLDVTKF